MIGFIFSPRPYFYQQVDAKRCMRCGAAEEHCPCYQCDECGAWDRWAPCEHCGSWFCQCADCEWCAELKRLCELDPEDADE